MDHMRISGTEPSSVILSRTMKFKKLKSDDPKVPKINPSSFYAGPYRFGV